MDPTLEDYKAACNLPGRLDVPEVEAALARYCEALGVKRRIERLHGDWLHGEAKRTVLKIAKEAGLADRLTTDGPELHKTPRYRFASWCVYRAGWWDYGDLSWLSTTWFGAVQINKPEAIKWSRPVLDAFLAGAWIVWWTKKTLYWVAKPTVHTEGEANRRLHREDGPALECDVENLYFWHGVLVPDHVVLRPESITAEEVRAETNAEVRRVLVERMTPQRYLYESKAELVHADHEAARKGSAPRALLRDSHGDQWLVGTDGGTKRVYYMAVPPDVTTCRAAHEAICGFDESKILVKS